MANYSLDDIFDMSEEELDSLIKKYKHKGKFDSKIEKRNAVIILAYNNDDLIKSDNKLVKLDEFDDALEENPKNAEELRKLTKIKGYKYTYSITFGDRSESHAGMQIIGDWAKRGLNLKDLKNAQKWFEEKNCKTKLIHLNELLDEDDINFLNEDGVKNVEDAYFLIIRKGLEVICDADAFAKEQKDLEKDTKAFMRGRVVNKHARSNLCFANKDQEADFENKKGTIIAFKHVPELFKVKQSFPDIFGRDPEIHNAEGNYYKNDITKNDGPKSKNDNGYITLHTDLERKVVVCIRLFQSLPLYYQWFYKSKIIGNRLKVNLHHTDIYIMSAKAVGTDGKLRNTPTLRHAAGYEDKIPIKPNWL
jgi:hypothetical protein